MRTALLALMFAAFASPAAADRYALTYDGLGLGFIPLGEITVDATILPRRYSVSAHLQSGGLLNLFERTDLRADSGGLINPNIGVIWRRYDLDHHYSRKHRVIRMRPTVNSVNAHIEPNYRLWGDPPASDEQKHISRDPLSTMMAMAVDIARTQRCAGTYPTFDGRFHYIMQLAGGETRNHRGGGYEGPVLECELIYAAVSGFEQTDSGRRRITQGHVQFALGDPAFAPPVRISTPLSAGGAVIRLTSWRRAEVEVETPGGVETTPGEPEDDEAITAATP